MSGVIDCMTRLAGASLELGKELATSTVDMAKSLAGGFVNGIGDTVNALKNLAVEEKKVYKEALNKYQESLTFDSKKTDEYIEKIVSDERVEEFVVNKDAVLENLQKYDNDKKCEIVNNIFKCGVLVNNYKNALNELTDLEDNMELYKELEEIKHEITKIIKSGDFNSLEKIDKIVVTKIEELRKKVYELMNNENCFDVEKTNEIYLALSSDIGEAYLQVFNNELAELLEKTENNELATSNMLLELKKQMVDYAFKLNNLEHIEGVEECQDMIEYVYNTLNDETISDDLKIERISIRVNALKDDYLKCELNNKKIFEVKQSYDRAKWLNVSYKKYLNMEVEEEQIDFNNLQKEIKKLENENKELYVKCEKKQRNEYVRKALREAMIENELEYIMSKSSDAGGNHIDQDIFHIENGDVVTVTINEHGAMNYIVGNTDIDGIRNSDEQTVETMKKFCSMYKDIHKSLEEKGVIVEEKRRLEPSVKYVRDIVIDEESKEKIRKSIKKSKEGKSRELKRKHLGDE